MRNVTFQKDATEWDGLYEDEDGYYTVDNLVDVIMLLIHSEKVNRKAAQANATKQQIDKVVKKMKDEGQSSSTEQMTPTLKATRVS